MGMMPRMLASSPLKLSIHFREIGQAALAIALTASCSGSANPAAAPRPSPSESAPPPGSGDRVLFIGNSLTEANDLPLLVEALATAGGRPLSTDAVVYGGVSLEDHWGLGTQNRIAAGGWRFVVLQQGPSALPASQSNLREWTARFDTVIRRAGATTALYMVWPESYRQEAFPQVAESYRRAAQDVNGLLLPVGEAWLAAWRRDPSLRLYGPDGFHPTLAGSYLAALTIYHGLTGGPTVGLPGRLRLRNGRTVEVDSREAALMQAAAEEVGSRAGAAYR